MGRFRRKWVTNARESAAVSGCGLDTEDLAFHTARRPPFEPELGAILASFPAETRASVTPESISAIRRSIADRTPSREDIEKTGVVVDEVEAPGLGHETVSLSVFRHQVTADLRPCIYFIHGGGMIAGSRMLRADALAELVLDLGVVVVSVEYRLAPEHPFPAGVDDCYAGLLWIEEHAAQYGIDLEYLIVHGVSAGGGLAAATALLARDRSGPRITHQILQGPMLDDRNTSASSFELDTDSPWNRTSNITGWAALLGSEAGGPDTSPYAAPARATNLSGLPHTYIDVGQVEVFRDEAIDFAARLSRCGVPVELHVWPGAWHGFDYSASHAALSQLSNHTRRAFIERAIASSPEMPPAVLRSA